MLRGAVGLEGRVGWAEGVHLAWAGTRRRLLRVRWGLERQRRRVQGLAQRQLGGAELWGANVYQDACRRHRGLVCAMGWVVEVFRQGDGGKASWVSAGEAGT